MLEVVGRAEDGVEQHDRVEALHAGVGGVQAGVEAGRRWGEEEPDGQVEAPGQGEQVVGGELLDPARRFQAERSRAEKLATDSRAPR